MRTSRVAWTAAVIGGVLALFAIVLSVRNGTFSRDPFTVLSVVMLVTYAAVGALVATRLPSNPIGWLMLLVAVSVLLAGLSSEYAAFALVTSPGSLPFGETAAWVSGWSSLPLPRTLTLSLAARKTRAFTPGRWAAPFAAAGRSYSLRRSSCDSDWQLPLHC